MKLRIIFVLTVLFSVLNTFAQTSPIFNRERSFDVQHYIIRLDFDHPNKKVFGETTVKLKPLKNDFNSLELDAAFLKFESVKLADSGKPLNFQATDEKIVISLDKSYSAGDLIAVTLKYQTQPKKGVYFVNEKLSKGQVVNPAQIWTQAEPEDARRWFPSYDFPDDKATSEQFLTVQKGETAIGNGELVEKIENANGTTTFHYHMKIPFPTYLSSFIIGKYVKIEDKHKNIPLGYYVYQGREKIPAEAFKVTPKIMETFENLLEFDFPFNKYDQTIVAQFDNFSGMENITATTLADQDIYLFEYDFGKETALDLIVHELAHSWFGNTVTCRNWAELWLNEGFATYMEAVYREKVNGRQDYLRKIREDTRNYMGFEAGMKNKRGLYNLLADPKIDDSIFDAITYQKGGVVLHTLREELGDEAFWKAVRLYLKRHKFANAETPDLQKAFEEASGKNLDWFFKQWVYGGYYPRLEISQTYSTKKKELVLTVKQTQKGEPTIVPKAFRLPLQIEIQTAKDIKEEMMLVESNPQTFTYKVNAVPTKINIDKNEKIPLKTVKILPLSVLKK